MDRGSRTRTVPPSAELSQPTITIPSSRYTWKFSRLAANIICRSVIPRRGKRRAKCGQFGKYCKSNRQVFSFSLFLVFSFFPRNPQGNLTNGACEGRVLFIGRGIAWKTLGARDKFLARFAEKRMKSVRKMGDWSVDLFKSTRWMINWKVQGPGRMLGRRVTTSRIFP